MSKESCPENDADLSSLAIEACINSTERYVDDFNSVDEDSCSSKDIDNHFLNRYVEVHEKSLTSNDLCCSGLIAESKNGNIACVLSDKSTVIFDRQTFDIISRIEQRERLVTDVRFSSDADLLYTSSLDGIIKIFDSRSGNFEREVNMNSQQSKKPITTFDISSLERLICAGTELVGMDSFLLFWDLRGNKMLGGYWESHSDDISCVRFNPNNANIVASAASDGLLNVFDVSQGNEDDALMYSLNTKTVVQTFYWRTLKKKSNLLGFMDDHSIQLWDIEEAGPTHEFSREHITKALKRKIAYECYTVPVNYSQFTLNPLILAGSGLQHQDSSCLRTLTLNEKSGRLEPHGLFVTEGTRLTSVVQAACFCQKSEDFITVKENGCVSLWSKKGVAISNNTGKTRVRNQTSIKPY